MLLHHLKVCVNLALLLQHWAPQADFGAEAVRQYTCNADGCLQLAFVSHRTQWYVQLVSVRTGSLGGQSFLYQGCPGGGGGGGAAFSPGRMVNLVA